MAKRVISKENKTKIIIWAVVYALIIIIFALLLLEGYGTFAGRIMNRPVADVYLNKHYKGATFDFEKSETVRETRDVLGVSAFYKAYRYTYKVTALSEEYGTLKPGDVISVDSYNFKPQRDMIYIDKMQNHKTIENLNYYLKDSLNDYLSEAKADYSVFDAYIDIKTDAGDFMTIVEGDEIKKVDAVIHVAGDNVGFDKYKENILKIDKFFDENIIKRPANVQVFYYYNEDVEQRAPAFESEFTKTNKNHYKVKLSESEQKAVNGYNGVKSAYIIILTITVAALFTLFVYRRIKKLAKGKDIR